MPKRFFFLFLILLLTMGGAQAATWQETARQWENTARELRESGDAAGAQEAMRRAAEAWEQAGTFSEEIASYGDLSITPAPLRRPGSHTEQQTIQTLEASIRIYEQAARTWSTNAELQLELGWDEDAEASLQKKREAERRAEELRWQVARMKGEEEPTEPEAPEPSRLTIADIDLSIPEDLDPELKQELVNRWAASARQWLETEKMWSALGNAAKAEDARARYLEAKDRLLEVDPHLSSEEVEAAIGLVAPRVSDEEPSTASAETEVIPVGFTVPMDTSAMSVAQLLRYDTSPLRPQELRHLRTARVWDEIAETWRGRFAEAEAQGDTERMALARARQLEARDKSNLLRWQVYRSVAERLEIPVGEDIAALPDTATVPQHFVVLPILASDDPIARAQESLPPLAASLDPVFRDVRPELPPIAESGGVDGAGPSGAPGAQPPARDESAGIVDLDLPMRSHLTINGRKVIAVNYTLTEYLEEGDRPDGKSSSDVDIEQELQIRVFGRVGEEDEDHINVNVQFDDTEEGVSLLNNRVIQIEFDGQPKEHAWGTYELGAMFGDITLTLPGTTYAFYNKSLFGMSAEATVENLDVGFLQADRMKFMIIGAQTQGESGSKEFSGGSSRRILDIDDVSYVRNRYYQLELNQANLPIANVTIWRDDQNQSTNTPATTAFIARGDDGGGAFFFNGNFDKMVDGTDYTINLSSGVVTFNEFLQPNDIVAVAYTTVGGVLVGNANPKMIRTSSDTEPVEREFFRRYELRNRYSLSATNIERDDGSFVFEIRDRKTGNVYDPASRDVFISIFNFDTNGDQEIDSEFIDYELGIIAPADTQPFINNATPTTTALSNTAIYTKDNPAAPDDSKYILHVEYLSKVAIYTIGFDIIKGSDRVYVDGNLVTRNADYIIDYETGFITFINPDLIKPSSTIRVDYEYLPFGGQFERTLLGARYEMDVNSAFKWGITGLFDFASDADAAPSVFEDAPDKLNIFDVNASLNVMDLVQRAYERFSDDELTSSFWTDFTLTMDFEIARSRRDPNTFGLAMLEDFESVDKDVVLSRSHRAWNIASRPRPVAASSGANSLAATDGLERRGRFSKSDASGLGHINPNNFDLPDGMVQESMRLALSFVDAADTWVAVRTPLTTTAVDLSEINVIEAYFLGADSLAVYLDVGIISEDADEDGVLDSEDYGRDFLPNTGDEGENNGRLNSWGDRKEDSLGIHYNPPSVPADDYRIGVGNSLLDTEDMNGNFQLDTRESVYRYGDLNQDPRVERQVITGTDGTQWTFYRIPFDAYAGMTVGADSSAVKHVRLWFSRALGADTSAVVYTDYIAFRGSRFKADSSAITLIGRNTEDDPGLYISLPEFRSDLDIDSDEKEQSLAIQYKLPAGETGTVTQEFIRSADLSDYSELSFYLYRDGQGETFTLRLLTDENNYIDYNVLVDTGAVPAAGNTRAAYWAQYTMDLDFLRQTIIQQTIGAAQPVYEVGPYRIVGSPATGQAPLLSKINSMQFIITPNGGGAANGEVWINHVKVSQVKKHSGYARRWSFASAYKDIVTVSGNFESIDNTFQGIGFINNPDANTYENQSTSTRNFSATVQLHRLLPEGIREGLTLPFTANWSHNESSLDPNRVETALKSSLGRTTGDQQSYTLSVGYKRLPVLNFSYSQNESRTDLRLEGRENINKNFGANTAYTYTFPERVWQIPTGKQLSVNASYSYTNARTEENYDSGPLINKFSDATTQNVGFGVNSTPFNFVTLTYANNQTIERRETQTPSDYLNGMTSRTQSLNTVYLIPSRWGFTPSLSMGGSYNESFNKNSQGAMDQDVGTTGNFSFGLLTNPETWWRRLNFFTLSYSYNISASASYQDIPSELGFSDIFSNFLAKRMFPWGQASAVDMSTSGASRYRSNAANTVTHNWSGNIYTWSALNTTYRSSLIKNETFTNNSLSKTNTLNAGLDMRLDYNRAFGQGAWPRWKSSFIASGVNYSNSRGAVTRTVTWSPTMSWSMQWTDRFNMVFNMNYNHSKDENQNSLQTNISQSLKPGFTWNYFFDLPVPQNVEMPITGRRWEFERRVNLSGSFNTVFSNTERNGVKQTDTQDYAVSLSLGYKIASNLELTASSSGNYFVDNMDELNSRYSVSAGSRLEWRF